MSQLETVLQYIYRLKNRDVFVETGTDNGNMIYAISPLFHKVVSIEIGEEKHKKALERFKDRPNVVLLLGDSGELIPKEANLYWLDAHCHPTAPETCCPLLEELKKIEKFEYILIDDISWMSNEENKLSPRLADILILIKEKWGIDPYVENDIMIIHNKNQE